MKRNLSRQPGTRALLSVALTALALLAGSAAAADSRKPQHPSPEQLRQAINVGYTTPKGWHQECLGRLVFDVPHPIEWGLRARSEDHEWAFSFDLREGGEKVALGILRVFVSAPETRADLERQREAVALDKKNAIADARKDVEHYRFAIDELSANRNHEDPAGIQQAIEEYEQKIKDAKAAAANVDETFSIIDIGIPDSVVRKHGDVYVYRDHKMFRFQGSYDDASGRARFLEMVKKFRYRKLYEVPHERGLCIPFGFLPDDGTTPFDIQVALRYPDRPGVLYTIATGTVGTNSHPVSEPTMAMAAALAEVGRSPGADNEEAARRLLRRIEPHTAAIGALPADQAGIVLNVADPGKPVIPNYSVYTGYGGWKDSQVLSFITVQLRSFTRDQERTLKAEPPPFDESYQRLNDLLRSIRLRPTQPAMPELAN